MALYPNNTDPAFLSRCALCDSLPDLDENCTPPRYVCPNEAAHQAEIERRNKIAQRVHARNLWNKAQQAARVYGDPISRKMEEAR